MSGHLAVVVQPVDDYCWIDVGTLENVKRNDAPNKVEYERGRVHLSHVADETRYIFVILIVDGHLEENDTLLIRPVQRVQLRQEIRAERGKHNVCEFLVAASG